MKYCTKCGTQLPDECQVCDNCQTPQYSPNTPQPPNTPNKKSKIKFILIAFLVVVISIFLVNSHIICINHDWKAPTCVEPSQCFWCDKYKDDKLGNHKWMEATCGKPRTCYYCDLEDGEPLNHDWQEATCISPKTCIICSATTGEATGHTEEWVIESEATKNSVGTHTKTCITCGKIIESEPLYYYDITEQEVELYTNALNTYYSIQQIHLNPESFKWLGVVVNNQTLRTTIYISYVGGDNSTYKDYFWKDLNESSISNKYGESNYKSEMLSLSPLNIDEMLYFEEFCGYERTLVSSENIEIKF